MSTLSTAIIKDIKGVTIVMNVRQRHPDGGISTEGMNEDQIKGTALIFLWEIAKKKKALAFIKALKNVFRDVADVFPSPEVSGKIIKTLAILEENRNDYWENWSDGPYSNGRGLKEEYMPNIVLEIQVVDDKLLKGFNVGDEIESAVDFYAYKWM